MIKNYGKKLICFIIILIFICVLPYFVSGADKAPEMNRILFISSYSYSWGTVPKQIEGISQALDAESYSINYEFMDTKNSSYSEQYKEYYDLLKYKLDNRQPYDGIIAGDDAALAFVMLYRDELFSNIPVVFEGVDNNEYAVNSAKENLVSGIVEKVDYAKNLEVARKLIPKATKLVLIFDESETGVGVAAQLDDQSSIFEDYQVEYINTSDYTKAALCNKLAAIGDDSIVFCISMGIGKDGVVYSEPDRYAMIRDYAKVPVFRPHFAGIGEGFLGGYIVDHEESGRIAGEIMKTILETGSVSDILETTPSRYVFDYDIIRKYRLSTSELPNDALLLNKPESFLQSRAIEIMLVLLTLLAAILVATWLKHRTNKKLENALMELTEKDNKLKEQYKENQIYIHSLEKKEEQIRFQAGHDSLTNMPNRREAMKTLEMLNDMSENYTVVIIDVDNFKDINDTYGHSCGDHILVEISKRLSLIKHNCIFFSSRFGGDEFLLILIDADNLLKKEVLDDIKKQISMPIMYEGKAHYIGISVGAASTYDEPDYIDEVLSHADLAMYSAKKSGKNCYVMYESYMKDELFERIEIERVLSDACRNDDFNMLYQPQVDVNTGEIVGYEALIRLKSVNIAPSVFVPIAEDTDMIFKLGRIVAEKVILQIKTWREKGIPLLPVSINFSSKQIRDIGYVEYIKKLLAENDISPKLIEMEITESFFIENSEKSMRYLNDFMDMGIDLALDDFGTGYSSISYLTYVPVKKIKMDKSVIDAYLTEKNKNFIESIISLAHSLGLKITIEGVEDKKQHEMLKSLKCDFIQGYYFSRPIDAESVEKLSNPIVPKEYMRKNVKI